MNVEICGVCCEGEAVFPMVRVVGDEGGAAVVVWRRCSSHGDADDDVEY